MVAEAPAWRAVGALARCKGALIGSVRRRRRGHRGGLQPARKKYRLAQSGG